LNHGLADSSKTAQLAWAKKLPSTGSRFLKQLFIDRFTTINSYFTSLPVSASAPPASAQKYPAIPALQFGFSFCALVLKIYGLPQFDLL
jgi:hypothetical protein